MSNLPPALVPPKGKISNRRFLERLHEWGCEITKSKGEWTWVNLPTGETVEVRSAHCHTGNSTGVFNRVLHEMGLTWEQFMGTDLSPLSLEEIRKFSHAADQALLDFIDELKKRASENLERERRRAQREAEKQQRRERWAREAQERQQRKEQEAMAATAEPRPTPEAVAEPALAVVKGKSRRTRIINHVYDALAANGEGGLSLDRLAEILGRPKASIGGACARLVEKGVAERVKTGVYRVKPEHIRQDVRISVAAEQQPAQQTQPQPASAETMGAVDSDLDETIFELLDLLLPDGVKARHMSAVLAWRDATRRLLRECTEDED